MVLLSSHGFLQKMMRIYHFKFFDVGVHQVSFKTAAYQKTESYSRQYRELNCLRLFERNIKFQKSIFSARYFQLSSTSHCNMKIANAPEFVQPISEAKLECNENNNTAVEDNIFLDVERDESLKAVLPPENSNFKTCYVEDVGTEKNNLIFKIRINNAAQGAKSNKIITPPSLTSVPVEKKLPTQPKPLLPCFPSSQHSPLSASLSSLTAEDQATKNDSPEQVPSSNFTTGLAGTRTETRVKMSRMRLRIAERLKDSQNTNAMLTTVNEIDMSSIIDFRKANMDAFQKKYGIRLGFMSTFIKAAAYALHDQPIVNAVIEENKIIYRDYIDISVAIASPKGLVVPVIRNVETKNFPDIELEILALRDKVSKGTLTLDDMKGGTFTITNGGVFGSLLSTPIINPPQSAILGMHTTLERPVAINGQVVIRPMMYVALTYDHRLIDGREAINFLKKIKVAVEDLKVIFAKL